MSYKLGNIRLASYYIMSVASRIDHPRCLHFFIFFPGNNFTCSEEVFFVTFLFVNWWSGLKSKPLDLPLLEVLYLTSVRYLTLISHTSSPHSLHLSGARPCSHLVRWRVEVCKATALSDFSIVRSLSAHCSEADNLPAGDSTVEKQARTEKQQLHKCIWFLK